MKGFGDQNEVKRKLRKSDKNNKPSKEQIINQAFKFHSEGKVLEAAKYYQYFINKGFTDCKVFLNYGAILLGLNKLEEAAKCYLKAIEIKPNYVKAHTSLGNVFKNLGKLEEAEICHRKAIELKPNYAEAYLNLGNVLRDLGKFQDAAKSLHKAIEIKPDLSEPYYLLSLIKNSEIKKMWQDQLFSEDILKNKLLYFFFSSKITIN